MENLQSVANYLHEQQLTVATAESCTSGLVAGRLGDMPGCGEWFKLGYVTYSATAKNKVLGVKFETIDQYNLTSEEVAREMVEGVLRNTVADIAVSNTGVAGPGPGEGGIPPGTICFGWGFRQLGKTVILTEKRHFDGDRHAVRVAASNYAVDRIPDMHAKALEQIVAAKNAA